MVLLSLKIKLYVVYKLYKGLNSKVGPVWLPLLHSNFHYIKNLTVHEWSAMF